MPAGKSEVCSATQLRITRRSRAVKSATGELFCGPGWVSFAEFCPAPGAGRAPSADGCGASAWLGAISFGLLLAAGPWVVTKLKTVSDSTTCYMLLARAGWPVLTDPSALVL